MVMEKPSPLLVGREFVRQYYTLLNKAPDFLHRFYGRNSSYVHGGLDSNGKLAEAVYGQAEIHKKVMSLQFSECHTKIRHVDAHATLSDGVAVQVMGELSNNGQPMRKFMQTFVLAPEGSVANKFYVHNDIFRYEDEVFGDSEAELDEESEEEVEEETEERQPSPDPVQENNYYEPHPVSNGVEEPLEEPVPEPEPELEPEPNTEDLKAEMEEKVLEEMEAKVPSPVPVESPPNTQEAPKTFSWASVTSKNLPPSGTVPTGVTPHVLKAPSSQPRVDTKTEAQAPTMRPRDQRTRDRPTFTSRGPRPDGVTPVESQVGKPHISFVNKGRGEPEQSDTEGRRIVRYPDSHQLFVGNLPHDIDEGELKDFFMTFGSVIELRINTKGVGGKLPNFGFVVFDDSDPVQRILAAKPIMFRGEVRLNVEEKKTRAVRERETRGGGGSGGDDRRDIRRNDRGPGGPRGIVGAGMMRERDGRGPPPRGGMAPKPGLASGRGAGPQGEGRFSTQRR
ncbi:ras GTPase-activating protein-binding protein 2 [Clupea harengus]|uniref:Ras GTPase-activating protein-binding protein 2 n=1 Tax=Clupea harengus TaxID=7950 RepID=A0A6P3W2K6_CLUHA|nr:ras GTPase-activating protein-binding protein 2 [Clupea harengus]XP_031415793.1 ras GTPase-activating protein-binding protein 2 [Clupea harengus]XP_031415794.1 ras GTPase-activating protein-binding protein 2 [Clupea harengus]